MSEMLRRRFGVVTLWKPLREALRLVASYERSFVDEC
jgi:hypothetical protein